MFHFWLNEMMPQANVTEPALYAVAILASPLSASECDGAKQGRIQTATSVRQLTGTVANVLPGGISVSSMSSRLDTIRMESRPNSTRGNPTGKIAGSNLGVLRSLQDAPFAGNDEPRQDINSPAGAIVIAAGAAERFGASFTHSYLHG